MSSIPLNLMSECFSRHTTHEGKQKFKELVHVYGNDAPSLRWNQHLAGSKETAKDYLRCEEARTSLTASLLQR